MPDEKFPPESVVGMERGTETHGRLQRLMEEAGLAFPIEQEFVSEDPPVRGFLDGMLKWNDELIPVEIKTAAQEVFMQRLAKEEGAEYQKLQLLLYMYILKLNFGILWYENNNNGEWLMVPVEMDEANEKLIKYVVEWMNVVYANEEKPKRPFEKLSTECTYCPFRKECWSEKEDDGVVDLPALVI